jgi:DNA-binding response OmpR family regulator
MPKIMLVEDDDQLRTIYQARLQADGYEVIPAKDGEEGLTLAKAEKPDLIIADIMMPKVSGFEMLDIIRNTDGLKDVKVIMLTALGQGEDEQRAKSLGADRYYVKTQASLDDIVKAVQELLGEK